MKLFKPLNLLFLTMFLFSVVVQYNDPDPWVWMSVYGLAGLACVVAIKQPANWWLSAALLCFSFVWAVTIAPRVWGYVRFGELFEAWEMKDMRVEEAREFGGLLIIAMWMLVLFLRAILTRRKAATQN